MKKLFKICSIIFGLFVLCSCVSVSGSWQKDFSYADLQDEKIVKAEIKRAEEWRLEGLLGEGTFNIFDKLGSSISGISSKSSLNHARECIRIVQKNKGAQLHIKMHGKWLGLGPDRVYYSYTNPNGSDYGSEKPDEVYYPWAD